MNLCEQLRAWRGADSLTGVGIISQAEAAALFEVPRKTYIDWEHGRHAPRGLALRLILQRIQKPLHEKKSAARPIVERATKPQPGAPAVTGGGTATKEQHAKPKSTPHRPRRRHPRAAQA